MRELNKYKTEAFFVVLVSILILGYADVNNLAKLTEQSSNRFSVQLAWNILKTNSAIFICFNGSWSFIKYVDFRVIEMFLCQVVFLQRINFRMFAPKQNFEMLSTFWAEKQLKLLTFCFLLI